MDWSRRGVLAGATALGASLAGCSALESLTGGGGYGSVSSADHWQQPRGTAGATGYNAADPSPPTAHAFDATLEGGYYMDHYREPLVGEDAVYAVGTSSDPYGTSPPVFELFAYAVSREDGSQLWRETILSVEGQSGSRAVQDLSAGLGPEALYVVHLDERDDSYGAHVIRVARDGSSAEELAYFEGAPGAAAPVVDDGTLHMFDQHDAAVAISTADGSVQYRTEPYVPMHNTIAPVVGSDAIAFVNRGTRTELENDTGPEWSQVSVFDRDGGTHRWTEPVGYARSIPTLTAETVYVVEGDFGLRPYRAGTEDGETIPPRRVRAFDLSDGRERWSYEYEREATMTRYSAGGAETVTVDDGTVYLALGFDDVGPPGTGEEARREARENRYRGPNLFALDRTDGSVQWETTLGDSAKVFAPTVVDETHLYALRRPADSEPALDVVRKSDGTVVDTLTGGFDPEQWFAVADGEVYQSVGTVRSWQ